MQRECGQSSTLFQIATREFGCEMLGVGCASTIAAENDFPPCAKRFHDLHCCLNHCRVKSSIGKQNLFHCDTSLNSISYQIGQSFRINLYSHRWSELCVFCDCRDVFVL